ncbi:MAG TPA: hypothetical protein VFA07_05530 [Chthonomonadaceae bacterium]|nr:hypothetical protein [Chthonomonadaceae bacterium]
MNKVEEEMFVRTFIQSSKQERYLFLLAHPKRRKDILGRLSHSLDYNPAYARKLDAKEDVETLLQQKGAGDTCYVISEYSDMDGQTLPLSEAIRQAKRLGSSILCCVPGRLAYYESEAPAKPVLLEKR